MELDEFDDFHTLERGILQDTIPSQVYPLWKFLILLVSVFFIMILTSFVVCMTNKQCRRNVPTVHSLLSSPISAPYMLLALSSGIYVFFITSMALYVKTNNKLVVITGIAVYASLGCILIVFPFAGWDRNWAIFIFVVTFFLWMISVSYISRKTYRNKLHKLGNVLIGLYTLSSIVYIVLKLLNSKTVGRDTGLLVVEVTGTIGILGFMSFCLAFVWKVKITVSPK